MYCLKWQIVVSLLILAFVSPHVVKFISAFDSPAILNEFAPL